jgi:uncharacterized protein YkwD
VVLLGACADAMRPAAATSPTPWITDRPALVEATNGTASPKPSTPKPARVPVPVPAATPHTVSGVLIGSRQQELANQARAAAGLGPLTWSACLAGVAAAHTMDMANAGHIYHSDSVTKDLACGLGSNRAGENVGEDSGGALDQEIFNAFMKSPDHHANIVGPYRYIGTAWVIGLNRAGYISVEFAS